MNPPFVRSTSREGETVDTFAAAFAAYGTSKEDQKKMSNELSRMAKDTCYDGNIGVASAFAAVANKKLKPNGILALILPLTVSVSTRWQKFRALLAKDYEEVEVVSLADAKCYEVAFSAFTSMADCLVIARKKSTNISSQDSSATRFVSLIQRPVNLAAVGETAKQLTAEKTKRRLEDGPFGGDEVVCGKEKMGETITANVPKTNPAWNPVRIQEFELIQTAYALTQGKLWLPARKEKPLAMTTMNRLSWIGVGERDAVGKPPRAPFDVSSGIPKPTDTYPALWKHDAKKETHLICEPDCKLLARPGLEEKANKVWETASRCHFNRNFTLGSQPLAVAITERPCIGGTAWPSINFTTQSWDYAFSLWGNSTLGLLLFWWHGNRQQPGRYRISRLAIENLPVLDFRALSDAQIKQAKAIFDRYKVRRFMPAYLAHMDPVREALDHAVLCEWLGFDGKVWKAVRGLAHKWCAEPSVHAGKQRSQNTPLVV